MPRITQITQQKRTPNRRNVFLDGVFAFGCNVNVVARFRLRDGMDVTAEQVEQIQLGEVKQECFDRAIDYLSRRLHSRDEIVRKLTRKEFGPTAINAVMEDLVRLGYIDDAKFAKSKATAAAVNKHHGKRRALMELNKAGVERETARRAVEDVYDPHDSLAVARTLAQKQAPRLKKLEPHVARRRLVGMLARRGFEYETIRPVIDEVLGYGDSHAE